MAKIDADKSHAIMKLEKSLSNRSVSRNPIGTIAKLSKLSPGPLFDVLHDLRRLPSQRYATTQADLAPPRNQNLSTLEPMEVSSSWILITFKCVFLPVTRSLATGQADASKLVGKWMEAILVQLCMSRYWVYC